MERRSGLLWKQARGKSFRSGWGLNKFWALRWLVVEDGRLRYYRTPGDTVPGPDNPAELRGTMLIYGTSAVKVDTDREFSFEIRGCRAHDESEPEGLVLAAESQADMQEWMDLFNNYVLLPVKRVSTKSTPSNVSEHSPRTTTPSKSPTPTPGSHSPSTDTPSTAQSQPRPKGSRPKKRNPAPTTTPASQSRKNLGTEDHGNRRRSVAATRAPSVFRLDFTGWQLFQDGEGREYYHHAKSGESTWERERVIALSWVEYFDSAMQMPYYYNAATAETRWDAPDGVDLEKARVRGRTDQKLRELQEREADTNYAKQLESYYLTISKQEFEEWLAAHDSLFAMLQGLSKFVNLAPAKARRLELAPDCSMEDIRKTYKRALAQLHPDKQTGDIDAQERARRGLLFDALTNKYEELLEILEMTEEMEGLATRV